MKQIFNLASDEQGFYITTNLPVETALDEQTGLTLIRIGEKPELTAIHIQLDETTEDELKKALENAPPQPLVVMDVSDSPILAKAKESLEKLDVTAGLEELKQQAEVIESRKALTHDEMIENARQNILALDKHLEEGGRVNVSDKYILNCQADLNQLVPFKYGWSWSLYLTSCDKHWMPQETNLIHDQLQFNNKSIKPSHKAILLRAWYNHQYQLLTLPVTSVLNCYRLITNPECRQYTLRQAFEMCLTKQAWLYMTESLVAEETLAIHIDQMTVKKLHQSLIPVDQIFKDRHTLIKENLKSIHLESFNTDSIENIRQFVYELLVGFGYVNWIMHLPTYYQIINLSRNENTLTGVSAIVTNMLKDLKTQVEYLKLLIEAIVKENPEVVDGNFRMRVVKVFGQFFDTETDIVSVSASTETEFFEVRRILVNEISSLLGCIGAGFSKTLNKGECVWFDQLLNSLTPNINHETGLSGGALEFDDSSEK